MRPCFIAAVCALALGGCVQTQTVAPPVTPAMIGASHGTAAATLEEGRRIFTGACTSCHSADPVEKHVPEEWRSIVAQMAPRAKLDATRQSALLAYLAAARATPRVL